MSAVPPPDGELANSALSTAAEVARYVVTAAVWAPSVHNTQPWRFTADGQQISLHADAGRQLHMADPDGREMMISCGAALFTARLALRALGYIPEFRLFPDPGDPLLVAELSWRERAAPAEWEHRLFRQVPQRRTHRGGFQPALIAQVMNQVRDGKPTDARLAALTDREREVLDLIADGLTNRQIGERLFLAEKTVKNNVSSLLAKLGMQRRTQAAVFGASLKEQGT